MFVNELLKVVSKLYTVRGLISGGVRGASAREERSRSGRAGCQDSWSVAPLRCALADGHLATTYCEDQGHRSEEAAEQHHEHETQD